LAATFYDSLTNGVSVTVIWGWVFVSLISLAIAASLAEICAVYPTAGGVYYWSAMLSTKKWAPLTSWVTGWLTLVGNWTVTTSSGCNSLSVVSNEMAKSRIVNFSGAQMILSAITLWNEDFVPNAYQTVLMYWAVMLVCALVNIFGTRWLDLINKMCLYWTSSSVVIIMVSSCAPSKDNLRWEFTFLDHPASHGEGQKECRLRFWLFWFFYERMVSTSIKRAVATQRVNSSWWWF
jgi:amino acid transporter